jgi:hypothetical protein
MTRIIFLAALALASVGFTSSSAEAQRGVGRFRPGNTCQFILQRPNTCRRGEIALCNNLVQCTYRGRPSRVCTSYRCIPRLVLPR